MVNTVAICEILSRIQIENRTFRQLYSYNSHNFEKHIIVGYNSVADNAGLSSFV